jgi:hypothetical protein
MFKDIIKSEDINIVKDMLQHNTNFSIDTKIIRRGRLLLYNIVDYHIKFSIKTNKNLMKVFEVPFPFLVTREHNSVIFSYKLDDLCKGNQNRIDITDGVGLIGSNKFYDKRLHIINMDL